MSIGNASQTRVAFVAESTLGTTPTSPSFQNFRYTGESMKINRENVVSNEIAADRNVRDLIRVFGGAGGGLDFEMSYGTLDSFLESALAAAWDNDVLKNGTTQKSFTIEKTHELGATDQFMRHTGMVADTMSLTIQAGQVITGSLGFVGIGGSVASAAISGATYTEANTNEVMNATSDFASLSAFSLSPTPKIMRITMNIANGLRQQRAVGNFDAVGIGSGRFELTGEMEAYFESAALYQKFLDGDAGGLEFTLGSTMNEKYTFEVPNLKFSDGEVFAGGNDQDLMVRLPWQGLYDTTGSPANDCTLKVTRAVA
jgi:hypothetical protein